MDYKFTENDKRILIEVCKLAVNYVSPIAIGPASDKEDLIKAAGTCSFVDTGLRKIIVTNYHVLREFNNFRKDHPNALFRIDALIFEPEERLIDKDEDSDLLTFSISDEELTKLNKQCCSSLNWPPEKAKVGESVVCAGFIGKFRRRMDADTILFEMVSMIELVKSSSENRFIIYLDKEAERKLYGYRELHELNDIAGMSGTIVLRANHSSKIMMLEPVGIIFEDSPALDAILCRHIDVLNSDGTLKKSIIRYAKHENR